jgi:hypothetical protein
MLILWYISAGVPAPLAFLHPALHSVGPFCSGCPEDQQYVTKSAPASIKGKLKKMRLRLNDIDLGEAASVADGGFV